MSTFKVGYIRENGVNIQHEITNFSCIPIHKWCLVRHYLYTNDRALQWRVLFVPWSFRPQIQSQLTFITTHTIYKLVDQVLSYLAGDGWVGGGAGCQFRRIELKKTKNGHFCFKIF